MTREIELKLALAEGQGIKLVETALLGGFREGRADHGTIRDSYFDTAEQHLIQRGVGIRIRDRDDGRRIQSAKSSGQGFSGLHDRQEWESPVSELRPDLSLLPDWLFESTQQRQQIDQQLAPVFTIEFERYTWQIEYADASIEAVLDQGNIRSGELHDTINEIELELKSGDSEALFDLAADLSEKLQLRFENQDKASRGYQLTQQIRLEPEPLQFPALPEQGNLEDFIELIFSAVLNNWQHNELCWQRARRADERAADLQFIKLEQAHLAHWDIDTATPGHEQRLALSFIQMTRALETLMTLLQVMKEPIAEPLRVEISRPLGNLLHALQPLSRLLQTEIRIQGMGHRTPVSLTPVLNLLESRKFSVLRQAMRALSDNSHNRFVLKLGKLLHQRHWRGRLNQIQLKPLLQPTAEWASQQLDTHWSLLSKEMEQADDCHSWLMLDHRIHELLLLCQTSGSLLSDGCSDFIASVQLLQGHMDQLHYLEIILAGYEGLDASEARAEIGDWLSHQQGGTLHDLVTLKQKLFSRKPFWQLPIA
ncbi:CYTH domain-containing protein [Pelagibaculum spongiae]|uniref:CYTH domain-containing protein n=1 Tax=Pelagibaculum spongiae TaxID=2080658 RepID=A0A2V1GTM7_9GAMM|nr:CYTH domain-containing protein [Pelagibaculum spongiae]PVZ67736.1 hypothetical protein DC094_14985 [Pelagibaculum spongiae]